METNTQPKHGALGRLAILGAALIWGSSFFVLKNTLDSFPTFSLLAVRFVCAFVLLGLVFLREFRKLDLATLWRGVVLGCLLFTAYALQTFGLMDTTPGKNAFLTAVYCVLVPFLAWIIDRHMPNRYHFIAALMCLGGIGLVSLQGTLRMSLGDGLTLLSGLFYALHIFFIARWSKGRSMPLMTLLQFACAAILCLSAAFLTGERMPAQVSSGALWSLAYLCVFPTAVALLLQNVGQKYTPPTVAGILLSLEAVFGVAFSMLFYGERITLMSAGGFCLIFLAVVVSETQLRFLRRGGASKKVK